MASNSNYNNSNYNKRISSLKQTINKAFSASSYGRAYGQLNAEEPNRLKHMKFRPTKEQYEQLEEMCRNKRGYYDLQITLNIFDLTSEEVLNLLKIDSEDRYSDAEFRFSNFHKITDITYLPEMVEIVKKDYYGMTFNDNDRYPAYSAPGDICGTFLNIFFHGVPFTFEKIKKTSEYLISSFEPSVRFIIENTNKQRECIDTDSVSSTALDFVGISEETAIEGFKNSVLNQMLNMCRLAGVHPDTEFVLENAEVIETPLLMDFYREHPEDVVITKQLEEALKHRCEHIILREFGPCGKLINIDINWDLNSMILFNAMNEDENDVYPYEDE